MKGFLLLFTVLCVAALVLGCGTTADAAMPDAPTMMLAPLAITAPVPGGDCAAGVCQKVVATCKSGSCCTVTAHRIRPVRRTVRATGVALRVLRVRKWPIIRRIRCCR